MKVGTRFNPMRFFWWLRIPLFWWVRTKIAPSDAAELELDRSKPVCYVLRSRSLSDLLVLDETCRRLKLPLPYSQTSRLKNTHEAAYVYLTVPGLFQISREHGKLPPQPIHDLVQQATVDPNMEVQIVPVSVFWGRNPGREERSLFKLLFLLKL